MKSIFKMLMYAVIGFAVGYLTLELLYGRDSSEMLGNIYYWTSVVMIVITVALLVYAFVRRRRVIKMVKDEHRAMDDDAFDVYAYNSFNVVTVSTSVALVMSLMSLAIQTMAAQTPWLVIVTIILLFVSVFLNLQAAALAHIIYPEKNLPEIGDKKYNQKLLAASDEGELFIMAKALYASWNLTSSLLFFAMILMTFYSIVTDDSQIFSIIITGLIMIVSHLKYASEIKER